MLSLFSLPARPGIGPMRRRRPPTTAEERRRRRASEERGITRPTTTSWNASAATEGSSSTTRTSRRRPGRCTPTRSRPLWEDPSLGWDRMYFFIIFFSGNYRWWWWWMMDEMESISLFLSPRLLSVIYMYSLSKRSIGTRSKIFKHFSPTGCGLRNECYAPAAAGSVGELMGASGRGQPFSCSTKKKKEKTVPLCWIELMRGAEILVGLKTCSRSRHTRLSAFGYFHFITSSWWLSFHANISRSFFLFANFSINMRKGMKNWCGENWPIIADIQHRVTGAFVPV